VLDGGTCDQGLESTIVALRPAGRWQILRPGPISAAQLGQILGPDAEVRSESGSVEAPGQLASHYAPAKPLRLGVETADAEEYLIGFGTVGGDVNLSPEGDLAEAASRLYACLHLADAAGKRRIAVAPIPNMGIGAAINDRLKRAAA
jgi:L-threonylcarbamoyladenylate synthase